MSEQDEQIREGGAEKPLQLAGAVQRWLAMVVQKLRYINGNLLIQLGDKIGGNKVQVLASDGVPVFFVDSVGRVFVRPTGESMSTTADLIVGSISTSKPGDALAADKFNLFLQGTSTTSIGFHDSGDDVGVLQYSNGKFKLFDVFGGNEVLQIVGGANTLEEVQFVDGTTLKGRLLHAGGNGAGDRYFGFINTAGDYLAFYSDITRFYGYPGAAGAAFIQINGTLQVTTQQAWQAASLVNSWVNYGGQFETAGYFKDSLGFVHMRGLVKSGSTNATIFTLPSGYRPGQERICVVANASGGYGEVRVTTGGAVNHISGGNGWVSLAIPPFRAEG